MIKAVVCMSAFVSANVSVCDQSDAFLVKGLARYLPPRTKSRGWTAQAVRMCVRCISSISQILKLLCTVIHFTAKLQYSTGHFAIIIKYH